ncbi:MAG: DUF488 domain-containing protein [Acidobacteriota bacterium]|nr:DUF488 domain-containing protein [Acidobacteriota bacterium]
MKLFTIGFTRKSAEKFFTSLQNAGVGRLLDVRLHNTSQLSGFAKRNDLRYFARQICSIEYAHLPQLAPTPEILSPYKKDKSVGWDTYARQYLALIESRRIEESLAPALLENACLLCSEDQPHHCHRRLIAEYLQQRWGNVEITHL